jgi:hypothetical protein
VLVPVPVQHQIAQQAPLVAYVPARLAVGWRYWKWTRDGPLRVEEQEAWRCVDGVKLVAATSLPPDRFADVGLGRIVASAHRIR